MRRFRSRFMTKSVVSEVHERIGGNRSPGSRLGKEEVDVGLRPTTGDEVARNAWAAVGRAILSPACRLQAAK